jgi:hypothetical protein
VDFSHCEEISPSSLLAMKEIELYGQHEKYKPLLDILVATEEQDMDQLTDLKEMLQHMQEVK